MTKVFIPTVVPDVHALAVQWALKKKGHEGILWYGSDLPTISHLSCSVGPQNGAQWHMNDSEFSLQDVERDVDVVWLRRPSFAQLPDTMHEGDKLIAEREWKRFVESLIWGIAPDAFWVNPMASLYRAESKPIQIREAIKVGLNVSNTLFSNDPDQIKSFLAVYPDSIFKPFSQGLWKDGDDIATSLTTPITAAQLPKDSVLRLVPGIFQERVSRKHELRVTIFGEHGVTVKIAQQEFEHSQTDCRTDLNQQTVSKCELPQEVHDKCIALMRRLDIVFGCFDFIVTDDDEYVFLEVNQMGQFLWIEDICPEIPMLDIFTQFLLSQSPSFKYDEMQDEIIYLSEFEQTVEEAAIKNVEKHHVPYSHQWQVAD